MADIVAILLLVITVLLLSICLFLADKVIGEKPANLTSGYLIKAIITSIVIIALIIGISAVIGPLSEIGIGPVIPIIAFVLSCYAIKMLLLEGSSYERSTWVGIFAWVFIYFIDFLAGLFGQDLIQFF